MTKKKIGLENAVEKLKSEVERERELGRVEQEGRADTVSYFFSFTLGEEWISDSDYESLMDVGRQEEVVGSFEGVAGGGGGVDD